MKLSSPNYPNQYNTAGIGCEWLISAPEGFIIALEFNNFTVSNIIPQTICRQYHSTTMMREAKNAVSLAMEALQKLFLPFLAESGNY